MKKRNIIMGLGLFLAVVMFLVITFGDKGREKPTGLGYQPVDEGDIFETGRLAGEFDLGPVNEEFLGFEDYSDQALGRYRKKALSGARGLGLIPSPVPVERHREPRAKTLDPRVYDDVYDLRDPNQDHDRSDTLVPPARDQGACGACWAFAAYGSLEGTARQGLGQVVDYSENHVLFSSGYDWVGCSGGNVDMVMAYLARHGGPVNEVDSPFRTNPSPSCLDCLPTRYIDRVIKLKARSTVSDIRYIKNALLEYGPLYASMNWSDESYHPADATYYNETYNSNHAVTLVGWDDHKAVEGASFPGVFIVRNSWGADWGDGGCFYVSYEDRSLAFSSLVAFGDDPDALLPFDRVYYHDPLGMTSSTGFGKTSAWGAAAFTAARSSAVFAVSFFTTAHDTRYEIRIHGGLNGDRMGPVLLGPVSGVVTGKGHHTVRLDTSLMIDQGEAFVVSVMFETPQSNWPVPLEKPFADYSSMARAEFGQTFLSIDGIRWTDTVLVFPDSSVCIKALVRETPCSGDDIRVSGAGHASDFLVRNTAGPLVLAVITDDCGNPIYDADVIASFGAGASDLVLYDDGQHLDGLIDDGIYAQGLASDHGLESSSVLVRAVKAGQEAITAGDAKAVEAPASTGGGGGGGCFIVQSWRQE